MSETRANNIRHHKKHDHTTVFPSDFFTDVRTSDPKQKRYPVKFAASKGAHFQSDVDVSPKKTNVSDSTSAISKENEIDEYVRLPAIRSKNPIEAFKEFTFPFKPVSGKTNNKKSDLSGTKGHRKPKDGIRRKPLSPKKLFNDTKHDKSSILSPQKDKIDHSRCSMVSKTDRSPVLERSISKSKSQAKYLGSGRIYKDGYDTDDHKVISERKYNSAFKSKSTGSTTDVREQTDTNILPIYESESDENTPIFDKNMEDVFEELWKLADENTPLPDIYDRNNAMETTFQFQKGKDDGEKYISFEKLINRDFNSDSCPMTVKPKSQKAKELIKVAPFRLSSANPEDLAEKTAYFGSS